MTVGQVKTFFYNLVKEYFTGATVVWGAVPTAVRPTLPFVTLQTGDIIRARDGIIEGNDFTKYIPCRISIDVNLYTKGKAVSVTGGTYYENTATEDLSDFVNFIMSPYAQAKFQAQNIGMSIEVGLRDLTQVLDEEFEYRAMQEVTLSYNEESAGYAGITRANWQQNSSGGGSATLAGDLEYEIDNVVFEDEEE
ncbi:MAG: hypothetical protein IJS71_08295 [Clostridia bacterium]|nr:hypothetical protein [Clostridia bacterium]